MHKVKGLKRVSFSAFNWGDRKKNSTGVNIRRKTKTGDDVSIHLTVRQAKALARFIQENHA